MKTQPVFSSEVRQGAQRLSDSLVRPVRNLVITLHEPGYTEAFQTSMLRFT